MSNPPTPMPDAAGFHNEPLTDFAIAANRDHMQAAVDRARARFDADPPIVVPVVIDGDRSEPADRF